MGMKIIFILLFHLFIQTVKNDIVDMKHDSICVNDMCTTIEIDLSDKIYESTTDMENNFSSENENEKETKMVQSFKKTGNEPKLKSSSNDLHDELNIVEVPNPVVLTVPKKTNDNQLINDKPKMESKTEMTAVETTTQLSKNVTKDVINGTNSNATKDIHQKHHFSRNQSEICMCDLKSNYCDINCCCDRDCNANMKTVFTTCMDSALKVSSQFCFNSKSIFLNNLESETDKNGLLCVVRNNLHPYVQFREEMIIDNVTVFNKRISRKKFFKYSPLKFDGSKMQILPYRYGDFVWSFYRNKTLPFGVPKQSINMQCKSKQNIRYLTDYETECLHFVPDNREKCLTSSEVGMDYFLSEIKLIKSPVLIAATNSSDKVCSNKTCIAITPYICPEDSDFSDCVKSTPKRLQWDKICKNVVSSVDYRIYHNGTDGIKEARAYFKLGTFQEESFLQKIKLKFLWVTSPSQVFKRSGNPGYIIGKPIISGRKVYSNNESMSLKKEAIELSYNPEDWLTVVGTKSGVCSKFIRRPIGFGENAHYSCFVVLDESDYAKRKCSDIQDSLFNLLLGDDFADVKTSNNMNKFVATFGNSEVENTGDWVQVIVDTIPMVSGQAAFFANSDSIVCKDIVSDLFIDVAYAKVGSFDKPQNKILGVRMHFGLPKNFVYKIKGLRTGFKLSTFVHFIDLTRQPRAEFAETPGFEAKLPHDFFYPFFSRSCTHSDGSFAVVIAFVVQMFGLWY